MATSQHIVRARAIKRTLGTYRAARYMAKRGWSIEGALWILVGSTRSRAEPQFLPD